MQMAGRSHCQFSSLTCQSIYYIIYVSDGCAKIVTVWLRHGWYATRCRCFWQISQYVTVFLCSILVWSWKVKESDRYYNFSWNCIIMIVKYYVLVKEHVVMHRLIICSLALRNIRSSVFGNLQLTDFMEGCSCWEAHKVLISSRN